MKTLLLTTENLKRIPSDRIDIHSFNFNCLNKVLQTELVVYYNEFTGETICLKNRYGNTYDTAPKLTKIQKLVKRLFKL